MGGSFKDLAFMVLEIICCWFKKNFCHVQKKFFFDLLVKIVVFSTRNTIQTCSMDESHGGKVSIPFHP